MLLKTDTQKIFCCLIAASLVSHQAFADVDYPNKLSWQFDTSTLEISLYNDLQDLDFETNNGPINRIAFEHGDYGLSYGYSLGRSEESISLTTQAQDFHGFYYFENNGFDFYFQEYRGYYLKSELDEQTLLYRKLEARTYTLNYYQKVAGDGRIRSMNKPITSPMKLSKLYFLIAGISDRQLIGENPIIPDRYTADFSTIDSLTEYHVVNATLSGGGYLSYHVGPWYVNGGLSAGFGYPISRPSDDIATEYSIKVNIKVSMGYSGPRYGFGLEAANDSDAFIVADDNTLQFHSITVRIILISYAF